MMAQAKRNQVVAGVGEHWRAGIAHQRDARSFLDSNQQFGGACQLVVFVIADGRLADAVVVQEFRGLPGVFAGDQVHFAQQAQRAHGNVLQVSDRRGNDIEGSLVWRVGCCGVHRGGQFITQLGRLRGRPRTVPMRDSLRTSPTGFPSGSTYRDTAFAPTW